jgi:hypothetical protein
LNGAAGGAQSVIDPMRNSVTKKCADRSTMEEFSFSCFCDLCKKEWHSVRYRFNHGGFAAPLDPKVFQLLWNDQHKAAFERANRDASFVFNSCPVCGRKVCNTCFYLAEADVSDICRDCLKELKWKSPC